MQKTPSFVGFKPRSVETSRTARGSSRKRDNKPEIILRQRLHAAGLRFRISADLPGKPDIVFPTQRIAIFVDGDFWHGKNLRSRLVKLSQGHNAMYWTAKIAANHARDKRTRAALRRSGWTVLRVWESDLDRCLGSITQRIVALVHSKQRRVHSDNLDCRT